MACINCDEACILIDVECLCIYTPLKGFELTELRDVIEDANDRLIKVTGSCDLCEDFGEPEYKYQEIIDNKAFKKYYAKLIYYHWLVTYGSGHATKQGIVSKASDEISDFRVHRTKEIKDRLEILREQLEGLEESFVVLMKEKHSTCFEDAECSNCGACKKECGCGNYQGVNSASLSLFGINQSSQSSNFDDMAVI